MVRLVETVVHPVIRVSRTQEDFLRLPRPVILAAPLERDQVLDRRNVAKWLGVDAEAAASTTCSATRIV